MKHLLRLAVGADVAALMTVVFGSWTRINGAGLTCPDWPLCRGQLLPSLANGTLWEWVHRLFALSVAPLIVALVILAWRERKHSPFIAPSVGAIGLLFLAQVCLGAATVRLANTPISVVLHWATAMALVAAISAMAVFAAASEPDRNETRDAKPATTGAVWMLATTAVVAFATMCVGAYVSSSGAGLACLSIPGCAGNVVVYTPGQEVQMLHRLAAAATLLCAAASLAVVWAHSASPRMRLTVGAGVALVCLQVLLGLLNVALRLPTDLREAHAVNAALVFLAFFLATLFAAVDARVFDRRLALTNGPR